MIADKPYYRTDELASAIDVSIGTVRRWLDQGLISHVHIVGVIRIPREEFMRILQDGLPKEKMSGNGAVDSS
jgi:excisionase family DNA binding protein